MITTLQPVDQLAGLKPELQLLIALAHLSDAPMTPEHLSGLVCENFNWQYFADAATFHGLLPIVKKQLQKVGFAGVPEAIQKRLWQQANYIQLRTLPLLALLKSTNSILNSLNIPHIFFKGPVLAATAYGDVGLRECGDIDILIARRYYRRFENSLLERGFWIADHCCPQLPITKTDKLFDLSIECTLYTANEQELDVHWQVTTPHLLALPTDEALQKAVFVNVEGAQLPTFPAEWSLVVLCVHSTKHAWKRLVNVYDVAKLLQTTPDLNWQEIEQLSDRLNVRPMVELGLLLSQRLFGQQRPQQYRFQHLSVVEETARQLIGELPILYENYPGSELLKWKTCLALKTGIGSKVHFIWNETFVPTLEALARMPVSPRLLWVYYIMRPFWLLSGTMRRRLKGN